jgi:hypothetical protein
VLLKFEITYGFQIEGVNFMDVLTRDELRALIEEHDEPCVSVFMPTHRVGTEAQQDPIRLNNLLGEVEELLVAGGLRAPEARKLLEPARQLLEDNLFWQHQSDGLAIFLSSDMFRYYRLPFDFEELVVVTDRFHIKPLLPLLSNDGRFYVLALSQNEVRLLQGTHYSIRELELEDVPGSLAEALRYDDPEKQIQFHTQTPGRRGDRGAIFHGHGVVTDDEKQDILRYFQLVDKGLHQDLLQDERTPLVLAGVEYLLPIYREATNYSHVLEEEIEGNPELLSAKELHGRAWAIVQPYFQQAQKEAVAQYEQLADTERVSKDIRRIVPAAHYGQVDTLFVAVSLQQWGTFDPDTNTIHLHAEAEPGDEDLLDSAVVQTLLHGGTVYALAPEKVPGGVPLAALFRYVP